MQNGKNGKKTSGEVQTSEVEWPTWLTPAAFASWYEEENRKRIADGQEQLPDLPEDVATQMGLRNNAEYDRILSKDVLS